MASGSPHSAAAWLAEWGLIGGPSIAVRRRLVAHLFPAGQLHPAAPTQFVIAVSFLVDLNDANRPLGIRVAVEPQDERPALSVSTRPSSSAGEAPGGTSSRSNWPLPSGGLVEPASAPRRHRQSAAGRVRAPVVRAEGGPGCLSRIHLHRDGSGGVDRRAWAQPASGVTLSGGVACLADSRPARRPVRPLGVLLTTPISGRHRPAAHLGCSPSRLTGLRTARYATNVRLAMAITQALRRSAAAFASALTGRSTRRMPRQAR